MDVVCLHGFGQSGDVIASKVKSLLTPKSNYNIMTINGCVLLDDDKYGWWIHDYIGLDNSVSKIINVCNKLQDYMVIGFSQGGCILDHLISNNLINPKYRVFIGSMTHPTEMKFVQENYTLEEHDSKNLERSHFIQKPGEHKTLHIIGLNDTIISPDMSFQLSVKHPGEVYTHQGKHVIPSNSEIRNMIKKMI